MRPENSGEIERSFPGDCAIQTALVFLSGIRFPVSAIEERQVTPMKTKIQLRNVEANDLPLFFEHQRDPIAVAMVAFDSRDRAAFDQHWAKLLADDSLLKKTVIVDGEVAGNIGSWTAEGKREVGYWIDRAFWGRGVATEALSAFLCLEQTRPLYAGVAKHNVASIRVLQKCGFKLSHSVEEAANDADASHVLLTLTA
jgi:RimJ/RimL family protein N-acetyltransferase